MSTTNPEPLMPRRRRRKGSIPQLRIAIWEGIRKLEDLLGSDDPETTIKAANALSALARSYLAIHEATDIEARLQALEQRLEVMNGNQVRRVI